MGQQSKAGGVRGGRYRCLFVAATAYGAAFLLLSMHTGSKLFKAHEPPLWEHRRRAFDVVHPFTIDTEGCTIPALKPFDDSIKKFVSRPDDVGPCRDSNFTLLRNNDTHIWVDKDYVRYLGIDGEDISCCYKSFYRPDFVESIASENIDNRVQYKHCIYFTNYVEIKNEFIRITCKYIMPNHEFGSNEQFFLFAREKPRLKRTLIEDVPQQTESGYNVLIMGLDSISRLNFYRTMPKTLKYLKHKGAIDLMGYNKVGDNTFPNLVPLLLGVKDSELPKMCWPHAQATFDNCPFVWEWFKNVGYYTALAEDNSKLGTFNLERIGFAGVPTDYYVHTFMHEAEKYSGNNMDFNCYLCMGSKYFYEVLLNYIENLTWTLKSSKLFGFFWEATMSHDYLNYPMFMDDRYEKFLKKLDSFNYLDNTILIFLSDHGIRWGDIRYTKQGQQEERLPLAYILLPRSFQQRYSYAYENLKANRRRLTTPFDLHATLGDLVTMTSIRDEIISQREKTAYASGRSISLFMPVPRNRTCEMAGIDEHWCTCHKRVRAEPTSEEASKAAAHLVRHVNARVRSQPQCARLRLAAVLEATELVAGAPSADEVTWREFVVVVRTEPGGAVFEGTLRHDTAAGWTLAGAVSRLNLYGTQSDCVHHYQLKLYCYCND